MGGHRTGGFAAAARVTLCFSSAKHTMLTCMFNYSFTNNHGHEWAQALCPVQPRFTMGRFLHWLPPQAPLDWLQISAEMSAVCPYGSKLLSTGHLQQWPLAPQPSCCSCDASGPVDAADLWLLMLCWSFICSLELPSVATEHRVYDK